MESGEPQTVLTVLEPQHCQYDDNPATPKGLPTGPLASSDLTSSFSVNAGAESTCTVGPTRLCPHNSAWRPFLATPATANLDPQGVEVLWIQISELTQG